jgi:orotate phosphoribosyltransferase
MITAQELLDLNPRDFDAKVISQEEILDWLVAAEAGWVHNGDSAMPHVVLASGMHSDGFFFCRKLLRYPRVTEILGIQLAKKLKRALPDAMKRVTGVVGSPYSAITLSYVVANFFGVPHCIPEKDQNDPSGKKITFKEEFSAGTHILQIEELVTTSGTSIEVRRAILEKNPLPVTFSPIVGVLVHRPPQLPVDYWNMLMVALVEKQIWAVNPADCPLCKKGSKAIKPKSEWKLLMGK